MTWYVVDGVDGSGKSTIANIIQEKLALCRRRVLVSTHPDSSCLSGRMTSAFLYKDTRIAAVISTIFYVVNILRSLHIKKKLSKKYDDFIFVRYDLAVAYIPERIMCFAYKVILSVLDIPDVRIFVDISPEVAMSRIIGRGNKLEMFETLERLTKVRKKMLSIARNWVIIDNSSSIEQTETSINQIISGFVS
ncbi:MAG: deoxynucleoside kinase [archaeon]|nr:deoxynucleoside kinase [archaeon]